MVRDQSCVKKLEKANHITMADLANIASAVKKLNCHNYNYWKTCSESYLQGQDLRKVVAGGMTTTP